ncbi:peptide ABC transporter substrate-binding protein, partial [Leptotrichia trevisanii]|uniref:peptide ABC transporter substrate-binding protein n=1 Tax=Leptotrichia trevisanii TaxID=109328 RepID=UPI0026F1C142
MKKMLFLLMMLVFVMSCGKGGGNSKTFTLNLSDEPKSIDPQLSTDILGGTVDDLITEGLTRKGKDGTFVPGLAEKWDKSADGLVWTFHLRDGIKWSNGDPITANDFKNGWLRALKPETASEYAYMLYAIKNAENYNKKKGTAEQVGIKVIDDKTLEVTLEAPVPYFDSLVAFKTYAPLNQKFFDETGDKYFTEADKTVSSGAYTMESWTHGSEMTFKKNPNYWDNSNVNLETVVYKIIPDNNSALNAFNNKEVDVTPITSEQAKGFKDNPKMVSKNDGSVWYLLFNFNNKTLANLKIRKALLMAIDREGLV